MTTLLMKKFRRYLKNNFEVEVVAPLPGGDRAPFLAWKWERKSCKGKPIIDLTIVGRVAGIDCGRASY